MLLTPVPIYTLSTDPELQDADLDADQLPAINKDRVPPVEVLMALLDQALAALAQGRTVAP